MGQRHQLFVIARVNGRYRTLCVIHHQWLYGQTALKRCLGTLRIFADPANRIPLQQELIAAQRHDEDFWSNPKTMSSDETTHAPFPFIATCLIIGASFDPNDGYQHNVSIEPFSMAYDEGDNNNGITIFDITVPSNVRYCFVDFHGMESERPVQLMTPLAARTYLEAYYDLPIATSLLPILDEFTGWGIIPVAILEDTWPSGEWEESESDQGDKDEVAVPESGKSDISSAETSKSLRDGALTAVLQALLDGCDEHSELLSEADLLTDFLPKLKAKLYEQTTTLRPSPNLLDLLCRALGEDADVDLSPFKQLSVEDLSLAVSKLRKHGKMSTLCLSNRPDLTIEDLEVVLRDAAGLEALYLLEDPCIPVQGMHGLLNDCDLYHSDLLRHSINPQVDRLLYRGSIESKSSNETRCAGQLCEGNIVSQLVWIGITERQACDKGYRLKSGLFDWESLRLEKEREMRQRGWHGADLKYKRMPLDMPLTILRTVGGLLCLLKWNSRSHLYDLQQFSRGVACSFAMGSAISGSNDFGIGPAADGNGYGVGPLWTDLYLEDPYEHIAPRDADENLEPGQWAIVLIHEAFDVDNQKDLDKYQHKASAGASYGSEDLPNQTKNQDLPFRAIKRLRYVLATPSTKAKPSDREFLVADIPTFLVHIKWKDQDKGRDGAFQKLTEAWNKAIGAMDTVEFYGDENIHDILPKVFPRQKTASSASKSE